MVGKYDLLIPGLLEMIATDLVKRDAWQLVALTHTKDGAWAKNYTPIRSFCRIYEVKVVRDSIDQYFRYIS